MVALGVLSNSPPNSYQPALAKGMHLRWGFIPELGFPWHGFYLFRRPARPGTPLCLSSVIGGLKKGNWPENKHYTALGMISSNTNLVLTQDFPTLLTNHVEFTLDGRTYLRFDLRAGELARRVEVRIGFRSQRCLDFQKLITLPAPPVQQVTRPNPLNLQGASIAVKKRDGKLLPNTQFESVNTTEGPMTGLKCEFPLTLTIKLSTASDTVELLLSLIPSFGGSGAIVEGFDSKNKLVSSARVPESANQPKTITLTGKSINRIEVRTDSGAHLYRICSEKFKSEGKPEVKVTAFSGTTPISSLIITGQDGKMGSASIEADAISAIEIGPCSGSLVDLCYVPVAQDATQGWEKLAPSTLLSPGLTYPIGLPVTHADYPCSVPDPRSLLPNRVRYQLPPGWERLPPEFDPPNFKILRDQLVTLVKGGPNGAPMADRIIDAPPEQSTPPDPNPPNLGRFYVLDMILLGALHPGLAQLLGLYWVDETVTEKEAFDYLIVADHAGVGQRDADKLLAVIQTNGFAQLDGYIVFNRRLEKVPPLPAPAGLKTFELPGGTFPDADGHLPPASNNAGLRWDLGWDASDSLLLDSAVMYLVWRAHLGDGAKPKSSGPLVLVTKAPPDSPKPLLVTEARLPNGVKPQRPLDWPPDPPLFIDRNLADGWYRHEVSGIDLFGRHSTNSAPAQLRLLDRIPPPMPTAVEAYTLDPEDRYLQKDVAYKTWRASLKSSVRQTLVGLRVRWIWTRAHQRQAPDAREFRIYFNPGGTLPLDHNQPTNWKQRFYVVGYNESVTIDSVSKDRLYEVFVPSVAEKNPASIPLNPSLADPVAYAHIGISAADDKPHTNDQRTSGTWSKRPGNEGRVGPTAKIYRVWRTPPPAPEDVLKGERLYASPADYHSRSFFTYRWKPQQFLKLHVFRAMDDGVFKADWSQRHLKEKLDKSQLSRFPPGWNQATRQKIAVELNHLNSFVDLANGREQAMVYYRQLSDGALRVLAGLPSTESAFVQLTINALDPNHDTSKNRRGPDNSDDLVLDLNQRAFIDTLGGGSTNRYFYRAAAVDAALNLGQLGLSTPPVYLPKVVAPIPPVLTRVRGGERQIELRWVKSREPDLSAYRVYRTSDLANTRDLRKMERVHELPVAGLNPDLHEVSWTDTTAIAGIDFHYRVTAVDTETLRNESAPSGVAIGKAIDTVLPEVPTWVSAEWVLFNAQTDSVQPWPESGVITSPFKSAIRLELHTSADFCAIYRRVDDDRAWQLVTDSSTQSSQIVVFDLEVVPDQKVGYRAITRNYLGVSSLYSPVLVVEPK